MLQVSIGLPILVGIYIVLRWVTCVLLAGEPVDDVIMGAQQVMHVAPEIRTSNLNYPQAVAALQSWWLLWYFIIR